MYNGKNVTYNAGIITTKKMNATKSHANSFIVNLLKNKSFYRNQKELKQKFQENNFKKKKIITYIDTKMDMFSKQIDVLKQLVQVIHKILSYLE